MSAVDDASSGRTLGASMRTLKAAVLYFSLVLGIGLVLGMVRVPFVVPRLGERYAELIEMPLMAAAIVLAARHVVKRFALPAALAVRLQVGVLTVAAELGLAAVLQSQSVAQYIASRDPVSGAVYLGMLLLFALMPATLTRVNRQAADHALRGHRLAGGEQVEQQPKRTRRQWQHDPRPRVAAGGPGVAPHPDWTRSLPPSFPAWHGSARTGSAGTQRGYWHA